jgi:Na+-transporting methylmalonyl-CoA/oxaloacetate decarboxylase gamma subunit
MKGLKVLGIVVSIIVIFFLGYFVRGMGLFHKNTIGEEMSKTNEIIDYNKNLSYTKQVFDHCNSKENLTEKMFCVNQYVVENYNYSPRNGVYSIDDMFDKGADCKSYSIYYATLANMMGYQYLFVQLPTHIFTLVYSDKGYCLLDEKFYTCFDYGEKSK